MIRTLPKAPNNRLSVMFGCFFVLKTVLEKARDFFCKKKFFANTLCSVCKLEHPAVFLL